MTLEPKTEKRERRRSGREGMEGERQEDKKGQERGRKAGRWRGDDWVVRTAKERSTGYYKHTEEDHRAVLG